MEQEDIEIINFMNIAVTLMVLFFSLEYWHMVFPEYLGYEIGLGWYIPIALCGYAGFRFFEWLFTDEGFVFQQCIVGTTAIFALVQWFFALVTVLDAWYQTTDIVVLFYINVLFIYWVALVAYTIAKEYRCA